MSEILGYIKYTTFIAGGLFGFKFFGFPFMVLFFLCYIALCVLDSIYGHALARQKMIVSSSAWDVGIQRKGMGIAICGIILVLCGALSHMIEVEAIQLILSLICYVFIGGFSYSQFVSIIENMAVSANGKEKAWLNFMLKIMGIGENKIKEKIEKYTNSL